MEARGHDPPDDSLCAQQRMLAAGETVVVETLNHPVSRIEHSELIYHKVRSGGESRDSTNYADFRCPASAALEVSSAGRERFSEVVTWNTR